MIVATAVFYDVREYRIPNSLILLGYITACILRAGEGSSGLGGFFLGSLFPAAGLFILRRAGILGGGDIKLLSVAGGFLGPEKGIYCVLYSFFFGALLSLIVMIQRGILKTRIIFFLNYIQTVVHTGRLTPYYQIARDGYTGTIHFSIAIMAAVVFSLWR